jgi:hypothetical protein
VELTGRDQPVRDAVLTAPGAQAVIRHLARRTGAALANADGNPVHVHVYGTTGRHRSVAIAEAVARVLRLAGWTTTLDHLHIDQPPRPDLLPDRRRYYEAPRSYTPQPNDPTPVFLAGSSHNHRAWRTEAAAVLLSIGVIVLNPQNPEMPGIPQAACEHQHLRRPEVISLLWLAARPGLVQPEPRTLLQLGAALDDPSRRIVVGADRDYPTARDIARRASQARPGLHLHATLDSALRDVIQHLAGPDTAS